MPSSSCPLFPLTNTCRCIPCRALRSVSLLPPKLMRWHVILLQYAWLQGLSADADTACSDCVRHPLLVPRLMALAGPGTQLLIRATILT